MFETWREAYRIAVLRAHQRGVVSTSVDAGDAAYLLVAQIEGTLSLARNSPETLTTGARALRGCLASMRAPTH